MRKLCCILSVVLALAGSPLLYAAAAPGGEILVANFNTGEKPNDLGGDFGTWDKDPDDETQGCQMSFVSDDALGDKMGYSVRLDYDVDSPNPAYNGFWMKLNSLDATPYKAIRLWLKGDGEAGYPTRLKIELKDRSNRPSPYILSGITDKWQEFTIPLDKFRRVEDWSRLNEFVAVFDDLNSRPKTGTVLIDQIRFTKEV